MTPGARKVQTPPTATQIVLLSLTTAFILGCVIGFLGHAALKSESSYTKGFKEGTHSMAEIQYKMEHPKAGK